MQNVTKMYHRCHSLLTTRYAYYLLNSDIFDDFKGLYRQGAFAYVMPKDVSIDIDDQFDFELAGIWQTLRHTSLSD